MTDQTSQPEATSVAEEEAMELAPALPKDSELARDVLLEQLAASRADATTYLEDLKRITADFDEFREQAAPDDEAKQYLDDLRRVAADFDNFRKRTQREMAENIERASQRVVIGLLPVLDSFDLAVAHAPETDSEANLLGGVRSTHQQLLDALTNEGLGVIPTIGEPFDPNVHEAVAMEGDAEHLVVIGEMRLGYTLHGRVIRAALVAVGRDPVGTDEEGSDG